MYLSSLWSFRTAWMIACRSVAHLYFYWYLYLIILGGTFWPEFNIGGGMFPPQYILWLRPWYTHTHWLNLWRSTIDHHCRPPADHWVICYFPQMRVTVRNENSEPNQRERWEKHTSHGAKKSQKLREREQNNEKKMKKCKSCVNNTNQ